MTEMPTLETIELETPIEVVCKRAESFPAGVLSAHQALHRIVPKQPGRKYYGISWGGEGITYLAAATKLQPGELEGNGLERFTIRPGKYLSMTLTGYDRIKDAFAAMLRDPRVEPGGYCVEVYGDNDSVQCLVTAE
jgi:hypothetical protein